MPGFCCLEVYHRLTPAAVVTSTIPFGQAPMQSPPPGAAPIPISGRSRAKDKSPLRPPCMRAGHALAPKHAGSLVALKSTNSTSRPAREREYYKVRFRFQCVATGCGTVRRHQPNPTLAAQKITFTTNAPP